MLKAAPHPALRNVSIAYGCTPLCMSDLFVKPPGIVSQPICTVTLRAPPIAPADLNVAMHKDGGGRFNSSPLLRQILQPLPDATDATTAEDTERGTRIEVNAARTRVDEDEDEDGGGDGSGGIDSPNDDAVAENVVSIVEGMGLDESEAAALRLAIARGDPNIRGALELFR